MPESKENSEESKREFYQMMDSIAETADPVGQNKRIKEAEFAEDSREPTEEETEVIRQELAQEKTSGMQKQLNFFIHSDV